MKVIALTVLFFSLFITVDSRLLADQKTFTANKVSIPFEITPSGHQVVTLVYDGNPIRMILDTAAGANVFSEKSAKRLKLTVKDKGEKAAGLGTQGHAMAEVSPIVVVSGEEQLTLRDLVSLNLSNVEAAGGKKGIDGLLGSPFFQTYKAQIDFTSNTLTIRTN